MTARFETSVGSPEMQARYCFQRTCEFARGIQREASDVKRLIVEVSRREHCDAVRRVRQGVLGPQAHGVVSTRVSRLPPGEFVRVTAEFERHTRP